MMILGDGYMRRVHFPRNRANVFKVRDILELAGIENYETVQGNGAVILLELDWDCIENKDDDN